MFLFGFGMAPVVGVGCTTLFLRVYWGALCCWWLAFCFGECSIPMAMCYLSHVVAPRCTGPFFLVVGK